jgi:protein gp37
MSQSSQIEWTNNTWNPARGCTKVSPGCKNCYAETFAERWRGIPGHHFEQGFDLRLVPEKLLEPLQWTKAAKVFVNSMSDLFHENIPEDYIDQVCQVMMAADWHTFQVLTKRPDRMVSLLRNRLKYCAQAKHILWGVTAEDRRYGVPRIEKLRQSGGLKLFLSIEPLLEDLGEIDLSGICWVIVGGESGPRARPIDVAWVKSIHRQCLALNIPFFFKQWGGARKKAAGRMLDSRHYDEFPLIEAAPMPDKAERLRLALELGF